MKRWVPDELDAALARSDASEPRAATTRDASIMTVATSELDAETMGPAGSHSPANLDSGSPETAQPPPAMMLDAGNTTADSCSREELRQSADNYLHAMATGDTTALKLHPSLRYTENGQDQQIGLGVWLQRPATQFARHVLDETRCTSVTEAVLGPPTARVVFGVRLRYLDAQLIDIEALVITQNPLYFDPDAIVPQMPDPWVMPLAPDARMSETALLQIASDYYDSAVDPSRLPPSTPECLVRQNGVKIGASGSCATAPDGGRFEQIRFVATDRTTGIAVASSRHSGMIGLVMFRAHAGLLDNVEMVGGVYSQTTGW